MARIKRAKRHSEKKTPWFRYKSNHPYKGQQQSTDPNQYAIGSDHDHREEEEGSYSVDQKLVDRPSSMKQVSNEFEENGGNQETEVEGDDEKKEGFGDVKAPENQDHPSWYHSPENGKGYDNWSDDRDRNKRCRAQPGTSPKRSESKRETETMKQENDHETGLERLKVWMDGMGLGEYVPLFELHKVDDEVLQLLTVKDLKDMGVQQVGLCWKIYKYVNKFCI